MTTSHRSRSYLHAPAAVLSLLCATVVLSAAACSTIPRADQDLFAAARANDTAKAQRSLAEGANVNARDDRSFEGLPPLAWAAGWGSVETAELLLARGAAIDGANEHGITALHVAAFHEQPAVVALLLRHGANVDARSEVGWTPLHKAMERLAVRPATEAPPDAEVANVVGSVKLLLASGARIDVRASIVGTPLHLAALTRQRALVEMLLDHGAAVDARDDAGMSPLYQAARMDAAGVAELLLARGAEVNARARHGNTPLSIAASEGNVASARVLLSHGAIVDARNQDGLTPLVWACGALMKSYTVRAPTAGAAGVRRAAPPGELRRDREALRKVKGEFAAVAQLLIAHGADPNVVAGDGTPLRAAALAGDATLVRSLLEHGAAIDAAPTGETPLLAAIAESHGDVAKLLIAKGANVNARNFSQRTALHFLAVFMHDRGLAELLIQRGADVNAKDVDGRTPLMNAIRARNDEVADALRRQGAE